MFVIVLAIWNCINIPMDIAFDSEVRIHFHATQIFSNAGFIAIDTLIDLLFLMDIFVNFRTTFYNKEGDEVFDGKMIAKHYVMGGRFTIDAIATIPFDWMGGSVTLKIFGLLKLARITRLSKIIQNLKMRDDLKAVSFISLTSTLHQMMKVLQLLFYLFLLVHCLACLNFFIVD